MKSSSRIAINTAATYTRSLLGVGLALFSSRWILLALGATDFGLFQVVGSLIVFLSFFNAVMITSAARHFAFSIGKGDIEDINHWFNTSLCIHLILPFVLIAIGWPIAEYVVRNVLAIPANRITACVTVFRISLLGAFINMASIPFVAMFTAKQRIAEVAFWGLLQMILIFLLAFRLTTVSSDRLLFYAIGMVSINALIDISKACRAHYLFTECKVRLSSGFDWIRFKALLSFAAFTLIGRSGGMLRNQGSSILINLHFGPVVNAAYGIANQVSVQTAALSAALMGAIAPEITAREGRGQRDSMISLSSRASKFGTLLVLLFGIPFILEADYVLKLWLVRPPMYAAVLCQLMMATFIADKLAAGYMLAVNAHGKIAAYQATVGVLLLMTLPLVWLLLHMGMPPAAVGVAFVIVQVLCSVGRVLWVRVLFNVPVKKWIYDVVRPCAMVAVAGIALGAVPRVTLSPSFTRLSLVCFCAVGSMILACWWIALSNDEQHFLKINLRTAARRLFESFKRFQAKFRVVR